MHHPATLVCTLRAHHGPHIARLVSAWQVRYHTKVIRFAGFISAELMPPVKAGNHDWRLIIRFHTREQLDRWLQSPERRWLVTEAEQLLDENAVFQESFDSETENNNSIASVTEIIRTEIHPGMEDAFRVWVQKIQHTQAQFEGYRGVHILAPVSGQNNEWTTLLRFDSATNLDRWLLSPERAALLEEARQVIQRIEATRLNSPFPGWVPIDPNTGQGPAKWQTGLLVLVGLYPVVMLAVHYVHPLLQTLNSAVASLLGNLVTVTTTTYLTMPFLVKRFGWWLFPNRHLRLQTQLKGLALILGLIFIEVILVWKLL